MHSRNYALVLGTGLVAALLAWGGAQGCNYSKSYFRLGPDGKMIKADGPVTPEELAGGSSENSGEENPAAGTPGNDGTGSGGEEIIEPSGDGGTTAGGGGSGTTSGGENIALAPTTTTNAYRRADFSFVYVAIDRSTKKTEVYLKTSATDSQPKKLSNMNAEYEQDPRPSVSMDNFSVIFTHTADWPQMYRITSLDQAEPSVSKWSKATGSGASFFADQEKSVFMAPLGVSLRMSKYDGTEEKEESEKGVGFYYGVSVNPTLDRTNAFYDKIVFSFDHDEDQPDKPALYVKDSGVIYPAKFQPLTNSPGVSEKWPSISPDGKRIAYVRDGLLAVCDLHYDTKNNLVCDNHASFAGLTADTPCWTADGSRIVFSTTKDGNAEIYAVGASNAADLQNLTNSPNTDDVQPGCFPNPIYTAIKDLRIPANSTNKSISVDYNQFNMTIKK